MDKKQDYGCPGLSNKIGETCFNQKQLTKSSDMPICQEQNKNDLIMCHLKKPETLEHLEISCFDEKLNIDEVTRLKFQEQTDMCADHTEVRKVSGERPGKSQESQTMPISSLNTKLSQCYCEPKKQWIEPVALKKILKHNDSYCNPEDPTTCPEGMVCVIDPPMPIPKTQYQDEYKPYKLQNFTKHHKYKDNDILGKGPFCGATTYNCEYIDYGINKRQPARKAKGQLQLGPWGMNGPTYSCVPANYETGLDALNSGCGLNIQEPKSLPNNGTACACPCTNFSSEIRPVEMLDFQILMKNNANEKIR